jgi:predicted SAM-dependent methyltransferase
MIGWMHGVKLNLGSGGKREEGYLGVDIVQMPGTDIIWDLTQFPYPAEDNSVDRIITTHTLEHFNWEIVVEIMNECWRILEEGHQMEVIVPLFPSESAIDDPAHKTFFGKESFGRFEPENEYAYEMHIINQWRRTKNDWTPEIEVKETSQGMQWLFPTRRELHVILEKLSGKEKEE